MGPVVRVWQVMGEPLPATAPVGHGLCSLTGDVGPLWRGDDAFSNAFTAYDGLRSPDGSYRVGAAAIFALKCWAFRCLTAHPERKPWRDTLGWSITTDGELRALDGPNAFELLSEPLGRKCTAWIGLSRLKHTLPWARWGALSLDAGVWDWEADRSRALRSLGFLRSIGVPGPAFGEAAVPWIATRTLGLVGAKEFWDAAVPIRRSLGAVELAERITRHLRPDKGDK